VLLLLLILLLPPSAQVLIRRRAMHVHVAAHSTVPRPARILHLLPLLS
jgi:hypothetical protein